MFTITHTEKFSTDIIRFFGLKNGKKHEISVRNVNGALDLYYSLPHTTREEFFAE